MTHCETELGGRQAQETTQQHARTRSEIGTQHPDLGIRGGGGGGGALSEIDRAVGIEGSRRGNCERYHKVGATYAAATRLSSVCARAYPYGGVSDLSPCVLCLARPKPPTQEWWWAEESGRDGDAAGR